MLGFWASRNVPIWKFRIQYPNGRVVNPPFKKYLQVKGDVIFKFNEPVPFSKGCTFSWVSSAPFEADVSPIFQAETDNERKVLQIDNYQLRLMQFRRETE